MIGACGREKESGVSPRSASHEQLGASQVDSNQLLFKQATRQSNGVSFGYYNY